MNALNSLAIGSPRPPSSPALGVVPGALFQHQQRSVGWFSAPPETDCPPSRLKMRGGQTEAQDPPGGKGARASELRKDFSLMAAELPGARGS